MTEFFGSVQGEINNWRGRAEKAEADLHSVMDSLDKTALQKQRAEAEAAALRAQVERAWLIAKELMHYPRCMKKEQGPCICGLGQLRATLRPEEESDG